MRNGTPSEFDFGSTIRYCIIRLSESDTSEQ